MFERLRVALMFDRLLARIFGKYVFDCGVFLNLFGLGVAEGYVALRGLLISLLFLL